MKLVINRYGLQGAPAEVILEHGEEKIGWNVALFDKMSFGEDFDRFEQINGYWNYLAKPVQDKIFDVYKRIRVVFDEIWDTDDLTRALYDLVAELYTHHDLQAIHHWQIFYSNLVLPVGLRESFQESHETPGTRERTYLVEDYQWLVTLSIAIRAMIPVWGEFIARTKKDTGTTFKEYYAFKLLSRSNINKSEPMERLRVYVEHSLPTDKSTDSAILDGISSEDFPTWVLGLVVVRRLSVGDIRGVVPNSSLVTFIYKYIGQRVKGHDNSFAGAVKDKMMDGAGQDGENNLSKLENYKIKQDIPDGDIAIIGYYMQDIEPLALKICPDIDLELVRQSLVSVQQLEDKQIWFAQVTVAQWVLRKVLPPRGLLHLNKMLTLKALALTQALLWHKGYFEIAALVSAVEQPNISELHLGSESRARITKEQKEVLEKLYPYSRRPTGKQKVIERPNPAVDAIEFIANMFREHGWVTTLPQEWLIKIPSSKNSRRFAVPFDIKVKLANLAICLGNRTF